MEVTDVEGIYAKAADMMGELNSYWALAPERPFSLTPERSGFLPLQVLTDWVFSKMRAREFIAVYTSYIL